MIAVITHPRDGADYLGATLADVDSSAIGRMAVVSAAPYRPQVRKGWNIYTIDKPRRPRNENRWEMLRCMELAVAASEDLVLLEDDVRLCPDAAWYLERFDVPADLAFVSFFDPWFDRVVPGGLWRAPVQVYNWAQCVKFPLRTCRALLDGRQEIEGDCLQFGADGVVRNFGARRDWRYAVHVPSLVQHVGAVSAVGVEPLDGRQSRSFNVRSARHLMAAVYR